MNETGAFFAIIVLTVFLFSSGLTVSSEVSANRNIQTPARQVGIFGSPTIQPSQARPIVSGESTKSTSPRTSDSESKIKEGVESVVPQLAQLSILTTQNIEYSSALLRGEISVGTETLSEAFFVYDYNRSEVDQVERVARSYAELQEIAAYSTLSLGRLSSSRSVDYSVSKKVGSLAPDTTYYARLCVEIGGGLRCSSTAVFSTVPRVLRASAARLPEIRNIDVTNLDGETAQFEARINMNDFKDGEIFLVYGDSESRVSSALGDRYRSIKEDDEDLQKVRAKRGLRGTMSLLQTVRKLESDTVHYYFWCVEYDGLDDGIICSRVYSVRTQVEEFGLTPSVSAVSVRSGATTAQFEGSVDMDEFRNGIVFFVYGTDKKYIGRIGGTGTFAGLRQSGDALQKRLVDTDLDRSESYVSTVSDLQSNATYYVRLCVEYENQDEDYRERQFLACGEGREFAA